MRGLQLMTARNGQSAPMLQKHEIVFQDLLSAIRCGKLAPGMRLPNEAELAEKYCVSRNSVRRGLMRLQQEGLLDKRQGSGSYVLPKGRLWDTAKRELALVVRYVPQSTEGLIAHATTGPWRSLLREGMAYGAAYHGVRLFDDPRGMGVPRVVSGLSSEQLAGFLVVAFGYDNPTDLMADLPRDVPKLLVNRVGTDPRVSYLTIDREMGAYQATSFLLSLGHRRIGIDSLGCGSSPPVLDRLRGYRRAFEAAGLPVDETMLFQGATGPGYLEWPKRLHELLKRDRRPTALIMHYDNQVLHIMEILQARGIRVPEDLSLIIIDDGPLLSRMTPRLSAISEAYAEMGRRAVGMILAGIKGGQESQCVALEPQLVMRESVLPLRT